MTAPFDAIRRARLFAAAGLERPELAVPTARALQAGGIDVIEVTLRHTAAVECIRRIAAEVPGVTLGAGTILTARQLGEVRAAGASFGVAPGFNPRTVRAAREAGLPFLPGVTTPGEMEQALELGCWLVKLFPAGVLGAEYVRAVAAPFAHTPLRFALLGGVTEENLADHLRLPLVAAVAGSWLADRNLAEAGRWADLTELARRARQRADSVPPS